MKRGEDHYARQARREGYPARSVYKLKEIQERFSLFKKGDRILDIGASPGSWSMYLLRDLKAAVVAIDLTPPKLKTATGSFSYIQGDISRSEVREQIRELGPYDAVISDAAPATTGNRMVDSARSAALVESALQVADASLKPGGSFVAKLFQGGGEQDLLRRMRTRFRKARAFKPQASRSESFETYFLGSGFLAKST
jgi:23S rRNA (uridine2552-2'-O)-methyltransferase